MNHIDRDAPLKVPPKCDRVIQLALAINAKKQKKTINRLKIQKISISK